LVEPLPFNVTVLPTVAVWFGPALATGPPAVVWKVHCKLEKLNGTVWSTWIVNVLLLVT
jgi:hypothetical protein